MNSNTVTVVVALIFRDGKFLMGRRLDSSSELTGYWEFPGGKIRPTESDEAALARELREELGCDLLNSRFERIMRWKYPKKEVELRLYWAEINPCEISALETNAHSELAWLSAGEALELQVLPANLNLLQELSQSK